MKIENLTELFALILAISLASERLVTIIKSAIPWLTDEKKTDAQEVDLSADKWRRIIVQLIAFLCAWITSSFLAEGGFNLFGIVPFGTAEGEFLVIILGLLASGGSAFWTNILGYTKAVKDIRIQERATASLKYHLLATSVNKNAIGSGQVADASRRSKNAQSEPNDINVALGNTPSHVASIQINI